MKFYNTKKNRKNNLYENSVDNFKLKFIFYHIQVFTSVALFNMLISPLNAFPWVLNGLVESWVSLKRVQAFLSITEVGPRSYYLSGSLFRAVLGMSFNGEGSNELISITDGSFTWKREDEIIENIDEQGPVEWLLDGINFSVRKV